MKKLYFILLFTALITTSLLAQTTRYVKPVATGTGDGSTWANATADLQGMINASASGDEVWVAAGKYLPTERLQANVYNSTTVLGVATTDRDKTFIMKGGVKVYGGFIGDGSETLLAQRNYLSNVTILSGDLNNDNIASDGDCYHVVSSRNTSDDAVLDGFTIQHGFANGSAAVSASGTDGLSVSTLAQNAGAGIATRGPNSSTKYVNLIIRENEALVDGGGAYLKVSGVGAIFSFKNVKFINNKTVEAGGALHVIASANTPIVKLSEITFSGNASSSATAGSGGGLYLVGTSATVYLRFDVINSVFSNNSSASTTGGGGAAYVGSYVQGSFINSTFYKNSAASSYGGLGFNAGTSTILNLYNNIFNGNTGNSLSVDYRNSAGAIEIFKNNLFQKALPTAGGDDVYANNIVNATATPLFASINSADATFLTLLEGVATEKGDNALYTGGSTDVAGNIRTKYTNIDLGAYEYQGVLPVELLYFSATPSGNYGLLTWKTASEQNSQKFVIERGTSLTNFAVIKEVSATGNSSDAIAYSFLDKYPASGTNYYRLTQYDNDGTAHQLGVKALNLSLSKSTTKVYPNPTTESVSIKLNGSFTESVSINLISLTGKTVLTKSYTPEELQQEVTLNLANVPAGAYIVSINKGKAGLENQTLMVVK